MAGKTKGSIGVIVLEPPITPTLAEAGIDKKLSSEAQNLADVSTKCVQRCSGGGAGGRGAGDDPTSQGLEPDNQIR